MVKIFKYPNGQIKIMWNEQPFMKNTKYHWCQNCITIKTYEFLSPFSLGIEMQKHTGGRICYGMLCANVQPFHKQNCVKIKLAYTDKNSIKYEYSSLFNDTYVYQGLPKEYTQYIMNQICSTISEKEYYAQCKIIIEDSANCEVGSSPMFFGIIANIMVNIIASNSIHKIFDMDIETFTKQYVKISC